MSSDDLIIAFYPCIYFSAVSQMNFSLGAVNYRSLSVKQKYEEILKRSANREIFYTRLIKFCEVCECMGLRMIFENPYAEQTYLKANFIKSPTVIDNDRMKRGDYFKKPTAYWFFNCEATYGESYQNDKVQKTIQNCKGGARAGLCSEERSMISSDYARNWICDFVLGKVQDGGQQSLFDFE